MTYYNTTIFPIHHREVWERQFVDKFLTTLFDPDQILFAINQENIIVKDNAPVNNLTEEQLPSVLEAIENGEDGYRLTTPLLISAIGFSKQEQYEMGFNAQLFYHIALVHNLRPLFATANEGEVGAIEKMVQAYIKEYPEQADYAESERSKYGMHLLSLVEPAIRAHLYYAQTVVALQDVLAGYDSQSSLVSVVKQIQREVDTIIQQVKDVSEIEALARVLETCREALVNPTMDTIQACINLGQSFNNHSLTKTLGNTLLTFAGLLFFSVSAVIAVQTLGLAAPLSVLGVVLGESIWTGALASGSAALGLGGSLYGASTFFGSIMSNPLSKGLDTLAYLTNSVQRESMSV